MMTSKKQYDILIVGGGMVGLAMASLLSDLDIKIALLEAKTPLLHWEANDYNARVSAINLASEKMLDNIGVWSLLNPQSLASFETMEVWDEVGGGQIHFSAAEMGLPHLGSIVENREIIRVLWELVNKKKNIDVICPAVASAFDNESNAIRLDDGRNISADLIIAADGARSWMSREADFIKPERPYDQSAIVAVIESKDAHDFIARQVFQKTGPLGFLPLANPNHSAIVWSQQTLEAERLVNLNDSEFNKALADAFQWRLGELKTLSKPMMIPLVERHARNYIKDKVVLIGDAAHTIHPLAGQGVNLGFADAVCLAESLKQNLVAHRPINHVRGLRQYERTRKGPNTAMMMAMQGFKSLFSNDLQLVADIRSMGLSTVDQFGWLKKCFVAEAS